VGQIPFTAIVEYSKIYEIEDFEEFLYLIRRMDAAFIKAHSAKEEANKPKPQPAGKTVPKPKNIPKRRG
jgi:hypothetical protein